MFDEFGVAQILVLRVTGHRQIRTVNLDHEARGVNRLVLLAHRVAQGLEIFLFTRVILVGQKGADDTRRRSVQKTLYGAAALKRVTKIRDIGFQRCARP